MRYIIALLAVLLTCSADARTVAHRRLHFQSTGPDADTVFLCHFDGADAATSATDVATGGNAPHTVAFINDAQLDTAQKKFGTASALFDGTGDHVTIDDAADMRLLGTTWTLEFWLRYNNPVPSGKYGAILKKWSAKKTRNYMLYLTNDCYGSRLVFNQWDTSNLKLVEMVGGSLSISAGGWHHVAVVRNGTDAYLFVDGTMVSSDTAISGDASTATPAFDFGAKYDTSGNQVDFDGWIDEVRVSTVARYTSNFTPAGPFTP